MKKPFLLLCLSLSAVAFAQTKTFMPDWARKYTPSEIEGNRPLNSNRQPTGVRLWLTEKWHRNL